MQDETSDLGCYGPHTGWTQKRQQTQSKNSWQAESEKAATIGPWQCACCKQESHWKKELPLD